MDEILNRYYNDNAKRLHQMVDGILSNFGGISGKDKDDFYSLANEVFVDVMKRYDRLNPFDSFLYSCLSNRIKSEMTKRNREKRRADLMTVSLDMPVAENEDATIGDFLASDFDIETEVFGEMKENFSDRMICYLERLSALQREVLARIVEGEAPDEIRQELQISKKQYADCYAAIHSYRNVVVLL